MKIFAALALIATIAVGSVVGATSARADSDGVNQCWVTKTCKCYDSTRTCN